MKRENLNLFGELITWYPFLLKIWFNNSAIPAYSSSFHLLGMKVDMDKVTETIIYLFIYLILFKAIEKN